MPGGVGAAGAGLFGDILSGEGETPPRSPPLVAIPPRSSARGDPVEELGPGLLSLPSRKPASAPLPGHGFPPAIATHCPRPSGAGAEREAREGWGLPERDVRVSPPGRPGGVGAAGEAYEYATGVKAGQGGGCRSGTFGYYFVRGIACNREIPRVAGPVPGLPGACAPAHRRGRPGGGEERAQYRESVCKTGDSEGWI